MRLPVRILQVIIDLFTSARFVVEGDSMLPTLAHGDWVLAVRPRFSWNQLRRGDIVVLLRPGGNSGVSIKRVIGLPGEDLRLEDGLVYMDGLLLEEQYVEVSVSQELAAERPEQILEWWTGPGEYVVLGDNRRDSQDSRRFGTVDQQNILGRVWFPCWPPKACGRLSGGGSVSS